MNRSEYPVSAIPPVMFAMLLLRRGVTRGELLGDPIGLPKFFRLADAGEPNTALEGDDADDVPTLLGVSTRDGEEHEVYLPPTLPSPRLSLREEEFLIAGGRKGEIFPDLPPRTSPGGPKISCWHCG